jgi:ribonucleoside-diphosphate reductase alpha subunit
MQVQKRDGTLEPVSFDKVLSRVRKSARGLQVNPDALAQQVLSRIYDKVPTTQLDELTAANAASLGTIHPDWNVLAARIAISNHQKNTSASFSAVVKALASQTIQKTGEKTSSISSVLLNVVNANAALIDARIDHGRDYLLDYFGFKTLEKSYLLRDSDMKILERPQHMWMRVSLAIWHDDLERAFETYDLLSQKFMTHATPTLFNAGTPRQQLSSCFLLAMADDSIAGIYKTLGDCAAISKFAGGIGLHAHNIRARGSLIRGTNGTSNGLVPMLRVFNNTARYVDQCFTPDTIVIGESGSERLIKDFVEGDAILTSDGYKKVLKVVSHWHSGAMKLVKVEGAPTSVRVTAEHPILSVKSNGLSIETIRNSIYIGTMKLDYLEVRELSVGDYTHCQGKLLRIESIEDTDYTGPVHDFEIEGPHDYTVAHLGVAHNGGGKRNGSFAVYLEPWHADVEDFLKLKLNSGSEEERARDLFYALWVSDLFMERVEADEDWTLFCPSEAPGLADVWGAEFKALYTKYEAEGRGRKTVKAQKLWFQILDTQIETGTPYLVYKDAANAKSNQQNLGTIKSSNLCSEIIEFSNAQETAVCNLASIALPAFIKDGAFDFKELRLVTKVVVKNLNRVIDINYYPTPETRTSNMRHRPIGLGIQGLADVFAMLHLSWEDDAALTLNQLIFEHMYYAAVESSCELADLEGAYETFGQHANPYVKADHATWGVNDPSPAAMGKLQPDLWSVKPMTETDGTLDWPALRVRAAKGLRNSLLLAPMPTASTSQILGYNECFEPFTSNLYTRRTLAGEFIVINKWLMKELLDAGIWNEDMKQQIIARNGSVQEVPGIPDEIKARYKTSWELKQRVLIDMAAARGAFICQSQSLNLFVADPNYAKLTSMHFYAWKKGLKTGCYYLRTKAPVAAQKFTVDPRLMAAVTGSYSNAPTSGGSESGSADSSDSEDEQTPAQRRAALKARLAAEYEAAQGEGCLTCSA